MAQIAQRRFIFLAHPPREIRIIQMLVARRLRHVLQHAQSLLDRALGVRGHLLPLRQDITADVLALFRRQLIPHLRALLQFLPLCWRQFLQPPIVLQDLLLFLRIQAVEISSRRRIVRRRWTVRIIIWPRHHPRAIYVRGRRPARVRIRRPVRARVLPLVLRPPCLLLLLSVLLPLFLSLLLPWSLWLPLRRLALLLWRLIVLPIRRSIRVRSLSKARHS